MTAAHSAGDEKRDDLQPQSLRQYEAALRSYFRRRVRNAAEVDDLVQEAFARLLAADQSSDLRSRTSYLFRIASNLLADRGRNARSPIASAEQIAGDDIAIVPPDQEHGRHYRDLHAAYLAALDELPATCRTAFILRRHHDRTTPEISQELRISARMVQKHLVRALAHLHERLHGFIGEGQRT